MFFGGSATINLNMTYIQDTVSSRGYHQFQVYNLAWPWDHPTERIKKLDDLIAAGPTLVLYGLGFASFGYSPRVDSPKCADSVEPLRGGTGDDNTLTFLPSDDKVLPTVNDAVNFFGKNIPIKLDNLENFVNPKHVTVNILRVVFEGGDLTTNTKTLPKLFLLYLYCK